MGATLLPFDEGGAALPDIGPQSTMTVSFQTRLNDFPVVYNQVANTVFVESNQFTTGDTTTLTVNTSPLQLEKSVGAIAPAASGTAGNIDVTYDFTVRNADLMDINSLLLTDDWSTQFGASFVAVNGGSVVVNNVDATTAPTPNATYTGGSSESMVTGGLLQSGQQFQVSVTVELDPDAAPGVLVADRLENQATVSGENVLAPGVRIFDRSDDPTDNANVDIEGDNEPDDPTGLRYADAQLTKTVSSVTPASSGTDGNVDAEFTFTVVNTGTVTLTNLQIVDDWATQLGGNFTSVLPGSVVVTNIDATQAPGANPSYSGGAGNLLDGTGQIRSGESFQVSVTVEIDPDADPASHSIGQLRNQATFTASDGLGLITDLSDDPSDLTEAELEGDNDADDPTLFSAPGVSLTKTVTNQTPAISGTPGNLDVTYLFEVTNVGSDPLTNFSIVDDWNAQIGGAFVGIIPGSVTVTNIDSTTSPGANAAYAGGSLDNLLDSTGQVESGQRFQARVVVEIDPDSTTGNYQADGSLANQAIVQAMSSSVIVQDISDDPNDLTNNDPDGDNNPDDATKLLLANLVTVKTLASGDATPDEGDTVTFQIQVTNNGAAQATNVSLTDSATDWPHCHGWQWRDLARQLQRRDRAVDDWHAELRSLGHVDPRRHRRRGQGGNTLTNVTTAATGDQNDPTTVGDDLTEQVTSRTMPTWSP